MTKPPKCASHYERGKKFKQINVPPPSTVSTVSVYATDLLYTIFIGQKSRDNFKCYNEANIDDDDDVTCRRS